MPDSTTSLLDGCRVPALPSPERFELAAYGALGAWWEYDHTHGQHDDSPLRLLPAPPPTDSLFLALLDGGLERWRHVRTRLAEWYLDDVLSYEHAVQTKTLRAAGVAAYPLECFQAEREAATHRFLALVQLVDALAARPDPALAPWVWPGHALRCLPPLLTAVARANLTLAGSSLDDPMDACYTFDRSDLVARAQVAAEQERIKHGSYHAIAGSARPPATFSGAGDSEKP